LQDVRISININIVGINIIFSFSIIGFYDIFFAKEIFDRNKQKQAHERKTGGNGWNSQDT
jgi:hypothetical protein